MDPRPSEPRADSAQPPTATAGSHTGNETQPRLNAGRENAHAFLSPPQQPDEIGRLGPYRVLAELGRGGGGAGRVETPRAHPRLRLGSR